MSEEVSIVLAQTEQLDSLPNTEVESKQESTNEVIAGNATTSTSDDSGEAVITGEAENSDPSMSSETYADFNLPEGMTLDAELLDKATPLFKELNLTKEQAQKFVDIRAEEVQASQQRQAEAFNQLKLNWQDQSKSDSDIGGDNFEKSVSDARSALDKFGTPELTSLLDDFGIGNNPEVIRFMAKVGRLTKEDNPGSSGQMPTSKKDHVSILYPSSS